MNNITCAFGVWFCTLPCAAQLSEIVPLAQSGDQLLDQPAGLVVAQFTGKPVLNDSSLVAVQATLNGPGVSSLTDDAIVLITDEGPRLIAREGDQVPGLPADTTYQLFPPNNEHIASDGAVVFFSFLGGSGSTGSNDGIIAKAEKSGLSVIARAGDSVPGLPAGVHLDVIGSGSLLDVNDSGAVVFSAIPSGPVSKLLQRVIVTDPNGDGSGLRVVAGTGLPAPGSPDKVIVTIDSVPKIDGDGRVAFAATFGDHFVPLSDTNYAIYFGFPDEVVPVAIEGGTSPAFPPGFYYTTLANPRVNPGGDLAFWSSAGPASEDVLVLMKNGDDPRVVLVESTPAPDLGGDLSLLDVSPFWHHISENARITTYARLGGDGVTLENDGAVVVSDPQVSSTLARDGDPATDQPPGVIIENAGFGSRGFDSHDRLAFYVVLGDGRDGIFLGSQPLQPSALLLKGDEVDLSPNPAMPDLRTISEIDSVFSINRHDEIVVSVAFNDGTEAVVLARLTPPCPADTNNDGQLTPTDFTAWIGAFNTNAPECDQNGDGMCTPTDFSAWIGNYNAGC